MKKIAILSLSLSFVLFNVFLSSKAYSQSPQTFTNSGNFTPAAGVNTLTAEAWGGGGGGGTKSSGNGGGGGGGGAYARTNNIPVTQGVSYPFVVGAGGNANTSGGFSSFNVNTI